MRFSSNISAEDVPILIGGNVRKEIQRIANNLGEHLGLPRGTTVVSFQQMSGPAHVLLGPRPPFRIELNQKYKVEHLDVAAVLAHEISHVFLHVNGISCPDTNENEILTDTAAAFLGIGWPCMNAHRTYQYTIDRPSGFGSRSLETTFSEESLGYITPEEFGYVIGKRSIITGVKICSKIDKGAARASFTKGLELAKSEFRSPPLSKSSWLSKRKYRAHLRSLSRGGQTQGSRPVVRNFGQYSFQLADPIRVQFSCPVCCQGLRLPTKLKVRAKCSLCKTDLHCST